MPNGTISTHLYKQNSANIAPRRIYNNEIHDSSGVTTEFTATLGNKTGACTIDPSLGIVQTATLTGGITLTLTSGTYKGQTLELRLTQDATGSRTATWPSNFKKAGGSLTLTTTANAIDVIRMSWDGSSWNEVGRSLNLS